MPKVEVMHIGGLQGEVIDLGDHYVFEIAGNEEQGCCPYCEAITPYKHGIKQPHYVDIAHNGKPTVLHIERAR